MNYTPLNACVIRMLIALSYDSGTVGLSREMRRA